MKDFPEFMKRAANRIPSEQQNTPDIEGYYYTAPDGSQMAFWSYPCDRVSKEHVSDYERAMRLYTKMGFKPIERYNSNERADVFMSIEL